MNRIPKAIYQTAEQIDARIRVLEDDAMTLEPSSKEHRAIMREIAQLRVYAEAKRWLAGPAKQAV